MPDLTGLTALDVAIGLFFLYFVLSIVCSTVAELISTVMGWRARNLELGLRQVLGNPGDVTDFFNQPRIRALGHPVVDVSERWWGARWWDTRKRKRAGQAKPTGAESIPGGAPVDEAPRPAVRLPSYIPSRAFALATLDTLAPDLAKASREVDRSAPASQDEIEKLRAQLPKVPNEAVRRALEDVLNEGRATADALRDGLERHFNEVMDRASGWYKRRAQLALVLIATAVTITGNVDSVQVASRLWSDDALRATVVQRANAATENEPAATEASLNQLADDVHQVDELGLPVGWSGAATPESFWGWLGKVLLGWPLTVAAIAMGAPFWFDVLGKVSRVRVAGKAEGTVKDDSGNKSPSG